MLKHQEDSLVNGGDCPYHWHAVDRILNNDSLKQLHEVSRTETVTDATYSVSYKDDIILIGSQCSVTLPEAKNGQEYEIVKTFSGGSVIIYPSGTDTVVGTTSVIVYVQWTALRFKAISGGWIII